ncbi:MAG: LON peptidase substrate-binding domain-containing protein [Planctomycetota bacterium]
MVHASDGAGSSDEAGAAVCEAPIFPLPNVFLFPGTRMPLHVFEPRYRQMVRDLLDGPGRLVLGTLRESGAKPFLSGACSKPEFLRIGGFGEIVQHEQLEDGRFYILVAGLARVRVEEVPCDKLYRRVKVLTVRETPVCPSREALLREKLACAVQKRCRELSGLPSDVPLTQLADLLLLRLQLPQAVMEPLFCELDVEARVLAALAEHARRPLPPSGGTA